MEMGAKGYLMTGGFDPDPSSLKRTSIKADVVGGGIFLDISLKPPESLNYLSKATDD